MNGKSMPLTELNPPLAEAAARQENSMPKKTAILQSAQEVFGRHGYSTTTMKMIAQEAGVAFGLVAHYYGNKESLFITAGFSMIDDLLATVSHKTRPARSGLDGVRLFVESYLAFTLEHRRTFPVLIRCSPFSDVELPSERERIAKKFLEIIRALQAFVRRGQQDGSINPELPEAETAFLIYSNIVGAVRTTMITPYDMPGLYAETVRYVVRSLCIAAESSMPQFLRPSSMVD
jgi:AcrR family transcriptional regulator